MLHALSRRAIANTSPLNGQLKLTYARRHSLGK